MNRVAAERVSATFQSVTAQIDDSIRVMEKLISITEFSEYRRAAGRIMGEIFLEILQPI
jgi:negative regulator of replication initiation